MDAVEEIKILDEMRKVAKEVYEIMELGPPVSSLA
jgi:hypothetical protein